MSWRWCDGAWLAADATPNAVATAVTVLPFETMGAVGDRLPLWPRHRARLLATWTRLALRTEPLAELSTLPELAAELLARNGHRDGVVRLAAIPRGDRLAFELTSRARATGVVVRLLPCVARRPVDAPPADLKCAPRAFYDRVLGEARAGGADDGIVLGDDASLLETAVGNLWLDLDGVWCTPPLDGRVLPGIARAIVLERAAAHGLAVAERRLDLGDLHRAAAIAVTNAVHGPRSAALPGATVQQLDTRLVELWRSALSD